MSVRQMKDLDKIQERGSLRLSTRQAGALTFGALLLVSLAFVVGIQVGRVLTPDSQDLVAPDVASADRSIAEVLRAYQDRDTDAVAESETERTAAPSETETETESESEIELVSIDTEFDDIPEEVAETVYGDGASMPPVYTPEPGAVRWRVKVPPRYPIKARRLGVSGEIVLLVTFDERGVPGNIRLLEGPDMFVKAAVNAVEQWRTDPVQGDDGWPIPFRQRIRLRFTLR